jgi:hypothetical protein
MSGYNYTHVLFQANRKHFSRDEDIAAAISAATGKDVEVKRENYDDGTWSTWFSVQPGSMDPWELGRKIEEISGLTSIMLRTDTNVIVPLHAMPNFPTGVIFDRKPPKM